MLDAIKYNLANLLNFEGRDARQTFWYYVLFIVILRYAASMLITVPMMINLFGGIFASARQGSDQAVVQQQMASLMADSMPMLFWFAIGVGLVSALLLVAALVRRLHDSDHSGWWAVIPAVLHVTSLAALPMQMRMVQDAIGQISTRPPAGPMEMMRAQGAYGLLGWLPIILVIIMGVLKSTPGPNRYGETPVSF